MAQQIGKNPGKRKSPSYIYVVVSMTLVLFLLGLVGVTLVVSQTITNNYKEEILVELRLKEQVTDADVSQLQSKLQMQPYLLNADYISKDEAAKIMEEDFGEDIAILGYNPLYASVNMNVKAIYANPDSLLQIKNQLESFTEVEAVYYPDEVAGFLNGFVARSTYILLGISIIFLIAAIALIDNTLRLAMFSSRFLIRSMQLVGATRWFIVKPFVGRGLFNGTISGLVAVIALVGLLYYVQLNEPDMVKPEHFPSFVAVFVGVLALGMLISFTSTWLGVRKYLRMKLDDLY